MDDIDYHNLRKVARRIREERSRIPEALRWIAEKGAQDFGRSAPNRLRGLAGVEALLEKSWEIRYDNPHEMVFRAALAMAWAQTLDLELYGAAFVRDVQGRALIELGNAHRVAEEFDTAQKMFDEATRILREGTRDELLEARLCDFQASLYADRRVFAESCEALDTVYTIHQGRGDHHLAGRALISKGIYTGYQGNVNEGEELVRRGIEMIDQRREPSLYYVAIQNLLNQLTDQSRFREARNLLFEHRHRLQAFGGKINALKLRAIEGRILAGMDNLGLAEAIFQEVRQAFHDEGLGYKEALASLELAVVLQKVGRDEEACGIIVEASEAFLSLGVQREALAAMLVLRKASQRGLATPNLLKSTLRFLIRSESNPDLKAEDFLEP